MKADKLSNKIKTLFINQVNSDSNLRNAYLLVHSPKTGVNVNIAVGRTNGILANTKQSNYMASVGKLFTAVVICKLKEGEKISFEDSIGTYLDKEITENLLVFKGKDYSSEIQIKHLLNHTSGLFDCFWPLFDRLIQDSNFTITPKEAINWGKKNCKSFGRPGGKMRYTDTNYFLLGLIIEAVAGKSYDEVLLDNIFKPLGMVNSHVLHVSQPIEKPEFPMAGFFVNGEDISTKTNFKGIDYAGGGLVSTAQDLLIFLKALVNGSILKQETLKEMMNTPRRFLFLHQYGYGVMRFTRIPFFEPDTHKIWGHSGATGSFLFYHPISETYIIGNYNDLSYAEKAVKFILMKVVSRLK